MTGELSAEVARDALAAVLEALDIPNAATMGDDETRAKILGQRTLHAVIMLRNLLGPDAHERPEWEVDYLRKRLAEHPAEGYKTWQQAMAELHARQAAEAVRSAEVVDVADGGL